MESFKINFHPKAIKELKDLPTEFQKKVYHKIQMLCESPLPEGVMKLKNRDNSYRIRVGVYRIIYELDLRNREIVIFKIRHRKDVYKDL